MREVPKQENSERAVDALEDHYEKKHYGINLESQVTLTPEHVERVLGYEPASSVDLWELREHVTRQGVSSREAVERTDRLVKGAGAQIEAFSKVTADVTARLSALERLSVSAEESRDDIWNDVQTMRMEIRLLRKTALKPPWWKRIWRRS